MHCGGGKTRKTKRVNHTHTRIMGKKGKFNKTSKQNKAKKNKNKKNNNEIQKRLIAFNYYNE